MPGVAALKRADHVDARVLRRVLGQTFGGQASPPRSPDRCRLRGDELGTLVRSASPGGLTVGMRTSVLGESDHLVGQAVDLVEDRLARSGVTRAARRNAVQRRRGANGAHDGFGDDFGGGLPQRHEVGWLRRRGLAAQREQRVAVVQRCAPVGSPGPGHRGRCVASRLTPAASSGAVVAMTPMVVLVPRERPPAGVWRARYGDWLAVDGS